MSTLSNRLRAMVIAAWWLGPTLTGTGLAHADPNPPPLPPPPGFPALIIPGTAPPALPPQGNPPIAPTPRASTIDARGINISTTATVEDGQGMPGARLGTPPSGVGVTGPGMDAGVSVGATGTDGSTSRPGPRQPPIDLLQNPFQLEH